MLIGIYTVNRALESFRIQGTLGLIVSSVLADSVIGGTTFICHGTIRVIKGDNCTLPYRLRYGTIQVIKGDNCTFYAKNLMFAQNILWVLIEPIIYIQRYSWFPATCNFCSITAE